MVVDTAAVYLSGHCLLAHKTPQRSGPGKQSHGHKPRCRDTREILIWMINKRLAESYHVYLV